MREVFSWCLLVTCEGSRGDSGDTTPCKVTLVMLQGVVSPELASAVVGVSDAKPNAEQGRVHRSGLMWVPGRVRLVVFQIPHVPERERCFVAGDHQTRIH